MKKNIIFIFSLPRSGSTLLQKMLGAHPEIKAISEPWFLLPLFEIDKMGLDAYYDGNAARKAIKDFLNNLPEKKQTYYSFIKESIEKTYYSILSNTERYLIDKTPRYFYIIPEIYKMFPDAKYIFLFRNPLAIYTSMRKSWSGNKHIKRKSLASDIYNGSRLLTEGYSSLKKNAIKIIYDDLVTNTNKELEKISDYLDLKKTLNKFNYKNTVLNGQLGDNIGINKYDNVSSLSIDKWKLEVNSIAMKIIYLDLLKSIPEDYLRQLGKTKQMYIDEIESVNTKKIGMLSFIDYKISEVCNKYFFRNRILEEILYRFRKAE